MHTTCRENKLVSNQHRRDEPVSKVFKLGFTSILTSTYLRQMELAVVHDNLNLKHPYVLSQMINDMG